MLSRIYKISIYFGFIMKTDKQFSKNILQIKFNKYWSVNFGMLNQLLVNIFAKVQKLK